VLLCLKVHEDMDIGGVSAPVVLPWLASILLDVAMGGDAVQNPAHVVFIIGRYHYSTKPTVILNFPTPGLFQLLPTVVAALLL
jgi:hypothetical protein